MIIKCPNYHKRNNLSCFYRDAFHDEHECRIKKGKVPCSKGLIDKKEYEKLAYPTNFN